MGHASAVMVHSCGSRSPAMEWGARSCTLLLLCLNGALSSSRVVDEATNAMVELQGTLLELQSDAKAEANDLYEHFAQLERQWAEKQSKVMKEMQRNARANGVLMHTLDPATFGLGPDPRTSPRWAVGKSQEKAFVQYEHAAADMVARIRRIGLRRRLQETVQAHESRATTRHSLVAAMVPHANALTASDAAAVAAQVQSERMVKAAVRSASCLMVRLSGQQKGGAMSNRMGLYALRPESNWIAVPASAPGSAPFKRRSPVYALKTKAWETAFLFYSKGYWVVAPRVGSKAVNLFGLAQRVSRGSAAWESPMAVPKGGWKVATGGAFVRATNVTIQCIQSAPTPLPTPAPTPPIASMSVLDTPHLFLPRSKSSSSRRKRLGEALMISAGGASRVELDARHDYTVGLWFRTGTTDAGALLAQTRLGVSAHDWGPTSAHGCCVTWLLAIDVDGKVRLDLAWAGHFVKGESIVNDGEWHHVTVTYRASKTSVSGEVRLYIDGYADLSAPVVVSPRRPSSGTQPKMAGSGRTADVSNGDGSSGGPIGGPNTGLGARALSVGFGTTDLPWGGMFKGVIGPVVFRSKLLSKEQLRRVVERGHPEFHGTKEQVAMRGGSSGGSGCEGDEAASRDLMAWVSCFDVRHQANVTADVSAEIIDRSALKRDDMLLEATEGLLRKQRRRERITEKQDAAEASNVRKATALWKQKQTKALDKLEGISAQAPYRTPLEFAADDISDASGYAKRQFAPVLKRASDLSRVASDCLTLMDKYKVLGRTYLEVTPKLTKMQGIFRKAKAELHHVQGLTPPLRKQLKSILRTLDAQQRVLKAASNAAPARLLQRRVWTDLATLPALHEYERQKMMVRRAHELAKNTSEIARTPGQGWQSRGLVNALLGGNALYLLRKLLLKPVDWEHGDFVSNSNSESNAPNWVQDRPNGRRLNIRNMLVVQPDEETDDGKLGIAITKFVQGVVVGCCTMFAVLQVASAQKEEKVEST